MACFWQDLVGATQVCSDGPPSLLPVFMSYNVGSGGGFFLFRSSWSGEGDNLIDEALSAEIDVSLIGYMEGEDFIELDPPVVGYYQPTGYGADPGGDPGDFQCLHFAAEDLDAVGFPFDTTVDIIVDFNPPGGPVATGTAIAVFGS